MKADGVTGNVNKATGRVGHSRQVLIAICMPAKLEIVHSAVGHEAWEQWVCIAV